MTATALHDVLAHWPSVRLGEYSGLATVADFGDVGAEFEALLSGCGVYDLGWRAKIGLTGGDRMRWLNGMVTNNIRDLAVGHGAYAFLLNPQGHILADLYVYNRGDSLLVDTDQSQLEKVLAIFDRYIIMDDVEVTNLSHQLTGFGVAGPKTRDVLRNPDVEFPQSPLQFVAQNRPAKTMLIVRGDNANLESYEVWVSPSDATWLWEEAVKAGARPVGTVALDLLRIACGIPRYGQDIREHDLPQETEQQRALHFSKGCYIGQEIVERIRSRGSVHRKFTGFMIEGGLPAPGAKIHADGKDVGEITSAASLPRASREVSVALGYIRREIALPGKQVEVGGGKAIVANLPFAEIFKH